MFTEAEFVRRVQFTNVLPDTTREQIREHCEIAARCGFQAVMLQPCWIRLAKELLAGTGIKVASAIAYPMGGETTAMKVALARAVVEEGADEFDFQPNIGFLRSGMLAEFIEEIRQIVEAADGRPVKSMSEFGFLNTEERILCLALAEEAGVAYVKNSSGIGAGGSAATVGTIRFMRAHLRGETRIKASGGIRTYDGAVALLEAGADLLGSSSANALLEGLTTVDGAY
jgi:deoxyribose-phosphate aldolase